MPEVAGRYRTGSARLLLCQVAYYAGQRDGPPRAWGVKPSLFGAVQMIDFTCMNSGARLDQGMPLEIRWPLDTASRPAEADRKDK